MYGRGRIAQLSFFFLRRSFFARGFVAALAAASAGRLTQPPYSTNEVDRTNILAPGFVPADAGITFLPPSPPKTFWGLAHWEVVSSYSSATAPDSHGISCADPLFQARKELDREVAVCNRRCKIYFGFILPMRLRISGPVQRLSRLLTAFALARRTLEGSRCVSLSQ